MEFRADDGQGVQRTYWAQHACVFHFAQHFDSRGSGPGASTVWTVGFAAEQMGIEFGGAWGSFALPPPREYEYKGTPTERETGDELPPALALAAGGAPAGGAAALLQDCVCIGEPEAFRDAVWADLEKIYATPTGKKLLESLAKSGKTVDIGYTIFGNAVGGYDAPAQRFFQADGKAGAGTNSKIAYNPTRERIGTEAPWETRPAAIGLAHELIHAEQAAYGRMCTGRAINGVKGVEINGASAEEADVRELEAVGVPPHDGYQFTENKIRAEWNPPQIERKWY